MASPTSSSIPFIKPLVFALSFLSIATTYCTSAESGYGIPSQVFTRALFCLNDNFIFSGCGESYRLGQSGTLNVPPGQTDQFCGGPCFAETNRVLNCIDNIMSNFQFYNRATVRDVRSTLRAGCSFTNQRGNFNVADQRYIWNKGNNRVSSTNMYFYMSIVILGIAGYLFRYL